MPHHAPALRRASIAFALVATLFGLFGSSSPAQAALIVALIAGSVCVLSAISALAAASAPVPVRSRISPRLRRFEG